VLYDSPTPVSTHHGHTIIALLIKERDVKQTTTLLVTQRYQDGNLIANFRYNSNKGVSNRSGRPLGPAGGHADHFMVLRDGR